MSFLAEQRRAGWATPARALAAAALALWLFPLELPAGPASPGLAEAASPPLPDKTDAAAIIARLREARAAGLSPSYVEFDLRELPRQGEERVIPGHLWLGAVSGEPTARVALRAPHATVRFLIRGGAHPEVWRWTAESGVQASDLLAPLVPGSTVTPFDLEMPYLFWPDPRVLSLNHILGRLTNGFVFSAPPDFLAVHPDLPIVRAYLDASYNVPLKVQWIGRDQQVRKTTALVSLKRVGGQWIASALDVRDELTHDKTRLAVTAASFAPELEPRLLQPEHLADPDGPAGATTPWEAAPATAQ
jgi:hypothetical protein